MLLWSVSNLQMCIFYFMCFCFNWWCKFFRLHWRNPMILLETKQQTIIPPFAFLYLMWCLFIQTLCFSTFLFYKSQRLFFLIILFGLFHRNMCVCLPWSLYLQFPSQVRALFRHLVHCESSSSLSRTCEIVQLPKTFASLVVHYNYKSYVVYKIQKLVLHELVWCLSWHTHVEQSLSVIYFRHTYMTSDTVVHILRSLCAYMMAPSHNYCLWSGTGTCQLGEVVKSQVCRACCTTYTS